MNRNAARVAPIAAVREGPGLAPTGKRIELEGADFYESRDGKVVRVRSVFDMADEMRQLGVLPPTGSRAERLTAKLANLRTRLGASLVTNSGQGWSVKRPHRWQRCRFALEQFECCIALWVPVVETRCAVHG
jgi:hypothetical protein